MPRLSCRPTLVLALLCAAASLLPTPASARADGDAPPAPVPSDLYEQTDRKKMMSMKLPRAWKSVAGDQADPDATATFRGFYGAETLGRPGLAAFYVDSRFARASLARAMLLPLIGTVKPGAMRQGPGWFEGCAVSPQKQAEWRRYVEKGGRVYVFRIVSLEFVYDDIRLDVEKLLDTAAVPGEFTPPSMGEAFTARKGGGEFDVMSDAIPDREKSIVRACSSLATAREPIVKLLAGKPFDASRPMAWVFQNAQKFEDKGKAAIGVVPEMAAFNPPDRCAMVSILAENAAGHDEAIALTAASQYVWQYFGGTPPMWVDQGLSRYGQCLALGGGKGKFSPDAISKVKTAVVAGKRQLDQWFDVVLASDVTDMGQASLELCGWHAYFRVGKGAKKYKKQYDAYIQSLRDSGDPAAARKAFDGVNFADMLAEFKSWAADWK